ARPRRPPAIPLPRSASPAVCRCAIRPAASRRARLPAQRYVPRLRSLPATAHAADPRRVPPRLRDAPAATTWWSVGRRYPVVLLRTLRNATPSGERPTTDYLDARVSGRTTGCGADRGSRLASRPVPAAARVESVIV